jgi:hypothetical protein
MSKSFSIISILLVSFFSSFLMAQAYRWVDDQGNTVYSQLPPPDDRNVTTIAPPLPPANSPEEAQGKLDGQIKQMNEAEEKRAVEKQSTAKKQADVKYKKQQCTNARMNLEAINNRPPQTLFQMGDGEYKRFTPDQRAAQIKQANETIKMYCR